MMKGSAIFILVFAIVSVQGQTLDTLVDVGGYKLHFVVFKGKGMPILFDAGGGEDATTWDKIIRSVAEGTAATLITYDRAGFGKSTFDTTRHGILNGMTGLEFAGAATNRSGILATGCGHFIFNDDPPLVINAIVKAYTAAVGKQVFYP